MIHHNLATYTLSEPYAIAALIYWLPDSSGLILALPISTVYDLGPPPTYEVWRYSLKTGTGTQIELDPPVMGHAPIGVSPDGNWIMYTNQEIGLSYLGDLQEGRTQSYGSAYLSGWSPDSVHFLCNSLYLASIHEPPALVGSGELVRWLDASRYVYFTSANNTPIYVMGEVGKEPIPILAGNIWDLRSYGNIIFHYHPLSD
jgi:hypothetical protein